MFCPEPQDEKAIVIRKWVFEWRNERIAVDAGPRQVEHMLWEGQVHFRVV